MMLLSVKLLLVLSAVCSCCASPGDLCNGSVVRQIFDVAVGIEASMISSSHVWIILTFLLVIVCMFGYGLYTIRMLHSRVSEMSRQMVILQQDVYLSRIPSSDETYQLWLPKRECLCCAICQCIFVITFNYLDCLFTACNWFFTDIALCARYVDVCSDEHCVSCFNALPSLFLLFQVIAAISRNLARCPETSEVVVETTFCLNLARSDIQDMADFRLLAPV